MQPDSHPFPLQVSYPITMLEHICYVQTEIDNLMVVVWEILFEDFPVLAVKIQSGDHARIKNVVGVFLRAKIF